ncbi:redox-regulated ATPase YchF, partial [Staphylococcus aureus]
LRDGQPARLYKPADHEEAKRVRALQLLTSKPVMYILNVDEASAATGNALSEKAASMAREKGADAVVISAQIEAEMAGLSDEEKQGFL